MNDEHLNDVDHKVQTFCTVCFSMNQLVFNSNTDEYCLL